MNEKTISQSCVRCPNPIAYLRVAIPDSGPVVLDFKQRWLQTIRVTRPVNISLINAPAHQDGAFALRLVRHGDPDVIFDMKTEDGLPLVLTPNGTDVLQIWTDKSNELVISNILPNACCCPSIY